MIAGILIVSTITDLMWHKRAFNSYREALWRGLIPGLICGAYIGISWLIHEFNPFQFLFCIYFAFNALLAIVLWATEMFYPGVLKLPVDGRYHYHFTFYTGRSMDGQANFYTWEEQRRDLDTIVKIIDEQRLLNKDKKDFKNDEEYERFLKMKADYKKFKDEIKAWHLTPLGYTELNELNRGHKKILYLHKYPAKKYLIGNCVSLPDKQEIEKRKVEIIICWAGMPEDEISQRLEPSCLVLDILNSAPLLESISIKDSRIAKLKQIINEQQQELEVQKSLDAVKNRTIYGKPGAPPAPSEMQKFYKLILLAIVGFAALIATFILLLAFGVI